MTPACPVCDLEFAIPAALIGAFFGLLVIAAVNDVRTMTIPNFISLALAGLYPVFAVVAGVDVLDGVIAGGAVLFAGLGLFALGWLGGGDVKLLAATALWAGTDLLLPALFITALAGGVLCLVAWLRQGGPADVWRRLAPSGGRAGSRHETHETYATGNKAGVVPYALAILAGGAFVAIAQLAPIWRLAETVS